MPASHLPTGHGIGLTGWKAAWIRFTIGPTLEMRLFRDLSFATGVTFSRAGRRSDTLIAGVAEDGFVIRDVSSRSRAIEIPLLAKYRLLDEDRTWRPFVTAGATIRRTTIETTTLSSILSGAPITGNPVPRENTKMVKWNPDPTVGIGADVRAGRFHLEPEVRYLYWGAGKHTLVRKNQVQLLLGFRFQGGEIDGGLVSELSVCSAGLDFAQRTGPGLPTRV